ncbi:hypothetical protein FHR83_006321 [Actinoplanes campanulatus]|uniref:DUF7919 domain-containing protein n=1 Tax=Actinoplanes campanulatus TaxID=113559 RepID=A0A7W5FHM7_9ACTN|nr:hypothetical protein [Actinoplanes campanulatus]MBB3098622.1 hypothetical protein [Actinoplanes campanulatus]GGN36190.1 hypothetical protein GCM10010109_60900 [Actinoplanes campanulatus]GID39313.1 hypothetical protein Aca09nite_58190 [Actinoplanes campanulatus]
MAYFDDLSPYAYKPRARDWGRTVLSVGWLDAAHEYRTGPTSDDFRSALLRRCTKDKYRIGQTRGFHQCNLPPCDKREFWPPILVATTEGEILLGSAEIRVEAKNGVVFAAPTLIYHYVIEHGYQPPDDFIEAISR